MFDKAVSWGDLIAIVLFLLGSCLLFYIIMAVANVVSMLRKINGILDKTGPNIAKTVDKLPEITENVTGITGLVKDNLGTITQVMENVGKISETAKTAADTIQHDVVGKVKSLLDVADGVRRFVLKKKDKSDNRKNNAVYRYTYKRGQAKPEAVVVETTEEHSQDHDTVGPDSSDYVRTNRKDTTQTPKGGKDQNP